MKSTLLLLLGFVSTTHLHARTWTSADGRSLEGELVSGDAANATIKRADGFQFTIPLSKLSQADQDFVTEKLKSIPEPGDSGGRERNPVGAPQVTIDPSRPWTPARQDIEKEVNSAFVLPVEDLLEPVKTVRHSGEKSLIWAPNPDGKSWDVIPYYYNGYGGASTLAILDLGSGEQKVQNYPRGTNWHLCPRVLAPNGKLYISTIEKGRRVGICIYDPAKNEMKLDALPVPDHVKGETHPIIRATDGMLFAGGGHPSQAASLIMIDPRDDSVTDFGAVGPSHRPSNAYNYTMGADDTHVYIASGKVPWFLVAVDRKTKKSTTLATTDPSGGLIRVEQGVHGVTAYVRKGNGSGPKLYWCHQGKLTPKESPCPFGKTGTDWEKALPPKPDVYTELIVPPRSDQQAEFWVKANVPNVAPDRDHSSWTCFRYDVPLYAVSSDRLVELPDGRIFGTAGSYAGHYIYDPADSSCITTGPITLSHYATVIHDNKVWMSGYPSSPLYVFDPAKPTGARGGGPGAEPLDSKSPQSNPRLLGNLSKSKCHKMYGGAVGSSGTLYFGGRWMRTGNGGGFGWWDLDTNEEEGLWEVFSPYQITHLCAAGGGKHIVISAQAIEDKVLKKPTPKEGKLFIFDDAKKEIVREIIPVEGASGPGPIVWAGGNRIIGWTHDPAAPETQSILHGTDVESGEVAWKVPIPFKLPVAIGSNQEEAWDFRLGPDGKIWTFMGADAKSLVRIDPKTAEIEAIARVEKAGRLAFSPHDIYLSGTTHLRRIKGVVATK